jgi:hypothetical protein
MRDVGELQRRRAACLPALMPVSISLILRCEPKASLEGRATPMQ